MNGVSTLNVNRLVTQLGLTGISRGAVSSLRGGLDTSGWSLSQAASERPPPRQPEPTTPTAGFHRKAEADIDMRSGERSLERRRRANITAKVMRAGLE